MSKEGALKEFNERFPDSEYHDEWLSSALDRYALSIVEQAVAEDADLRRFLEPRGNFSPPKTMLDFTPTQPTNPLDVTMGQ